MSNINLDSDPTDNPPPDWDSHPTDLLCPLCGYNLRHLAVARCPECGFTFHWAELIEAEKTKHQYLFEHGSGHNFKTFWKTFWTTCRPRKFWRDLNPAQPVRLGRLIIYWLIATCVAGLLVGNSNIAQLIVRTRDNLRARNPNSVSAIMSSTSQAAYNAMYPLPWELEFWKQIFSPTRGFYGGAEVCAIITTYRLNIAFRKYLRVHLPLATVVATQLIVVLLAFVVLAQFARF